MMTDVWIIEKDMGYEGTEMIAVRSTPELGKQFAAEHHVEYLLFGEDADDPDYQLQWKLLENGNWRGERKYSGAYDYIVSRWGVDEGVVLSEEKPTEPILHESNEPTMRPSEPPKLDIRMYGNQPFLERAFHDQHYFKPNWGIGIELRKPDMKFLTYVGWKPETQVPPANLKETRHYPPIKDTPPSELQRMLSELANDIRMSIDKQLFQMVVDGEITVERASELRRRDVHFVYNDDKTEIIGAYISMSDE